jgi:hypothetical protein
MKGCLAFLLLLSGVAIAQSPGTFTPTGNMLTPRLVHTATLLPDGRVLIAGGWFTDADGRLISTNSAELYDPATGTFAATGSMTTARYEHTSTLLPDGRVLIAGGGDASGHLALSAELYDPSTGTFTATGSLAAGHWRATLLNNGKVLMGLPPDASAELYDPATGTFTGTGGYADTTTLWLAETATLLADGKALIAGDSSAELYDPLTGTFNLTGAMIYGYAAVGRSATLLTNGRVLFAGGSIDTEFNIGRDLVYSNAELYDPSTGDFIATGNMTETRSAHMATLLPDGSVLITGGAARPNFQSAELHDQRAERYDPSTGRFSSIGNMTALRTLHTATLLKDGRVLLTGGEQQPPPPPVEVALNSAELYTPPLLTPAPVLFSLSDDGRGQGAVWHATTGKVVSASSPAVAGEALSMYTTSLVDGGVVPPQVAVGGRLAEILFFGKAPGYLGFNQVNFLLPNGVAPGTSVTVRLTYLGRPSNEVTISVQ